MGTETMGRVLVTARIENMEDLYKVSQGTLRPDEVRHVEVTDALVETGATMVCLPHKLIERLGLTLLRTRESGTAVGRASTNVYGTIRLTIQDRDCPSDVVEVPDDCPALIGQVPLELLDFVVDPKGQKLIGNPEHGGQHMIDMY